MNRYKILKNPNMKPVTAEEANLEEKNRRHKPRSSRRKGVPFNMKFEPSETMGKDFNERFVRATTSWTYSDIRTRTRRGRMLWR